jgi:hypothetical protein
MAPVITGAGDNLQTLIALYNLPADMIPSIALLAIVVRLNAPKSFHGAFCLV